MYLTDDGCIKLNKVEHDRQQLDAMRGTLVHFVDQASMTMSDYHLKDTY
jgi:hypothetical protein